MSLAAAPGDLHGHHAVITGGAQGIGLAIARRYLRSGASVSLWDVSASKLDEAVNALAAPGRVQALVVDVRDEAQVMQAAQRSLAALGAVTVLVNNAGVLGPTVNTWETTPADWRNVLDINLTGAYLCCRALVPQMLGIATPARRVINIASVAGKEGNAMNAAYSASKAGLIALTKSLAKELATAGVLVNCITPSAADTAVFAGIPPEHREQLDKILLARVPMGRFVEVDEVAAMAAWLASADCSFSTGAVFDITGGRSVY
ncbi:SDR family NAD(P)-dependent oxidoreductase [Variovorax sp. J22G21]|uniref:SDR family NAD(P)-dependent oxidoreductase n=1 Tax=Variovorax fucosicus TaxID=3053517 RepID=UPI0025764B68|nr:MULTISPECIES: SDR family NAD(P)-dependent oxidoreductase [unclassified Variovorax]MDM0038594.1 SDR family NAD(P)-dependent oxidoreductase [Variovorax sp. J22R193]MDM0063370.1 SDR family NAD(P)-dependent oxidoreductase [Variovorax sp. J22G21]